MKSLIILSIGELGAILGLLMATGQWLAWKDSMTLLNWIVIGFILLAIVIVAEGVWVQGTIRTYRGRRSKPDRCFHFP